MSTAAGLKLDPADPAVRRLVYNAYRGLLRQSSQLSGDGSPSPGAVPAAHPRRRRRRPSRAPPLPLPPPRPGGPPAPPPPPPPGPGRVPAVRLNTEIPDNRGPREPPAAIQNAMMTKDKKPFTYTPGGLDLSQIRSPRMQRRIVRNAANEGVGEAPAPKPSPLAQSGAPLPPSALAAMQPALPVAVFHAAGAPAPSHHDAGARPRSSPAPPRRAARPPSPAARPRAPQQQQARSPPAAPPAPPPAPPPRARPARSPPRRPRPPQRSRQHLRAARGAARRAPLASGLALHPARHAYNIMLSQIISHKLNNYAKNMNKKILNSGLLVLCLIISFSIFINSIV
ncbi:Uncharacterized protein GBIM_03674, partial [Gryllus bimaculatus]